MASALQTTLTKNQARRLELVRQWMAEGAPEEPSIRFTSGGERDERLGICAACDMAPWQECEYHAYEAFIEDPAAFLTGVVA